MLAAISDLPPRNESNLLTAPYVLLPGDLPKVPTLPQRSLLLRKLVQYQQLARPQQQLQQPSALSHKQQVCWIHGNGRSGASDAAATGIHRVCIIH
jgi:hypothetical protein